jgi:hypothetical protein
MVLKQFIVSLKPSNVLLQARKIDDSWKERQSNLYHSFIHIHVRYMEITH